jgi:hypothetical protein
VTFNTGDCLIEVTAFAGLTHTGLTYCMHLLQLKQTILSVIKIVLFHEVISVLV